MALSVLRSVFFAAFVLVMSPVVASAQVVGYPSGADNPTKPYFSEDTMSDFNTALLASASTLQGAINGSCGSGVKVQVPWFTFFGHPDAAAKFRTDAIKNIKDAYTGLCTEDSDLAAVIADSFVVLNINHKAGLGKTVELSRLDTDFTLAADFAAAPLADITDYDAQIFAQIEGAYCDRISLACKTSPRCPGYVPSCGGGGGGAP